MLSLQAILNDYNNRSKLYYHDQKLFKFRKSVWLEERKRSFLVLRVELFKVLGKVLMVCFPAWRSVLFVGVISLCLSSPIAEKIKKKTILSWDHTFYCGERDSRVASY